MWATAMQASEWATKHHRAGGHDDGLLDGVDPVIEFGFVPIGLFDDGGIGQAFGPAGLPVAGAGAAQAGQDQDVGFGDFHERSVLSR